MSTKTETPRIPAIAAEITGTRLVFTTATGEALTVEASALSPEIQQAAMMHGLKQKIGDAAALSRNPETGRSATLEDKFNAMTEVFTRLESGQWNKTRESGETAGGLLFKALCKVKPEKAPAEIRYWLDGLDKTQQAALRKLPAIANAIEEIRAANAKTGGIDGEALLAGF